MKRIILMGLILGTMVVVLFGCGQQKQEDLSSGTPSVPTATQDQIPEIKENEAFLTHTEHGDYYLTIEKARVTDDRNITTDIVAEKVVYLDYMYENVSFVGENNQDLNIPQQAFQVMDDSGTVLNTYPVFDRNRMINDAPIGAKCNASIAYALPQDSNNLTIIFRSSNNRKFGQIVLPITE